MNDRLCCHVSHPFQIIHIENSSDYQPVEQIQRRPVGYHAFRWVTAKPSRCLLGCDACTGVVVNQRFGGSCCLHLYTSPWIWRQYGRPKRWYHITSLHGVTTQKSATWIHTLDLHAASINNEDGGEMVIRNTGILPHLYAGYNPEDNDFNIHRRENFKSHI